jgi:hypothetical protein
MHEYCCFIADSFATLLICTEDCGIPFSYLSIFLLQSRGSNSRPLNERGTPLPVELLFIGLYKFDHALKLATCHRLQKAFHLS